VAAYTNRIGKYTIKYLIPMDKFMQIAIDEAKKGLVEGGIPIGSVLVKNGKLVATGALLYVCGYDSAI